MVAPCTATVSERWSWPARSLGIGSSIAILAIGILYAAVITLWLIIEAAPSEPIGDPYLAIMEVLTMTSAAAFLGLVIAVWCFADDARRLPALTALVSGSLAVGFTMAVHFVQLTAIRQLWRAGRLSDYRLVWPSAVFAVEYFAWDVLVGASMVAAGFALAGSPAGVRARLCLLTGGMLCLVGATGPLSGRMVMQDIAVFGYAVVLPIAGALTVRLFRTALPHTPPPNNLYGVPRQARRRG
jgi:hypothetical protein